jgi:hypothetical protein
MRILDSKRVQRFGIKAFFHITGKNTNLPVIYSDNLMNRPKRDSGG